MCLLYETLEYNRKRSAEQRVWIQWRLRWKQRLYDNVIHASGYADDYKTFTQTLHRLFVTVSNATIMGGEAAMEAPDICVMRHPPPAPNIQSPIEKCVWMLCEFERSMKRWKIEAASSMGYTCMRCSPFTQKLFSRCDVSTFFWAVQHLDVM